MKTDTMSTCRCWPAHCLGVLFALWLLLISHVKTDGKLDIRFISYWSDGKEMSGYCCDSGLAAGCIDKCDPMFTLCIDGPGGRESCSLYKRTTNYIDNHNIIHFGSSIQGTANPFIIQVLKAVPSAIEITVQVYDNDDTSSDDHMDTFSMLINIQAATSEQTALYTPYTVSERTKLKIEVRAYCDPDWFGSGCETYCKATPDQIHYTCNEHTGAKMCFEGWKGDNCNQDIDECVEINSWCQNGGNCTNTHGSFQCICMEGIKGRRCENITNQCALKPCLNGGTCDGNQTDFNCSCSEEWTGDTCAESVNFCDSAPCYRGNCTQDLLTATRFKCICDFAWVGERCSRSVDIINITLLGAIDHTNEGNLTDGLHRLITELGKIPGKVDVKITTNKHTERNYTTTYIQLFSALENDTFLDSALVNTIFESNSDEVLNEYLPLPLYPPRQEEKSTVKKPHDNWDTVHYVPAVLLPLGLVLMTVLLLVAICIWRRKSDMSKCTDDDNNDQINSFEMDVPCNRNPQSPGTISGNLQGASVSPDGKPCLHFHDVHEGALDTHCDDTSNIHGATGNMNLVPLSQEAASVSPDDNARHGDITQLDTHRHATSNIHNRTGDMTLDLSSLHGASVLESVNTRLHDEVTFEARPHVAAHLPVDVLHLRQTINYEPLDRCEEEDTEYTDDTDVTDVENISEEDPYVDVVVLRTPDGRAPCSLYEGTTNYIDNHNTIHFGSSILGTANLIIIPVPKAVPFSIEITVQVFDNDDTSSDDHMDTLSKRISIRAAATEQTAVYTPYTVWGRTKLQIEVRAYCDPDWYGSVYTVNITLLGEIDHTNRGDLTDGLNRLIPELGEIPGKVDVKFAANTQTECKDTSQCIEDENDQINSFGMDVPRNRNPIRPGTITGSLQGASVSPDGNPCLHFHDVDEGALDPHCDDTSNIHGATGDMTLVPWSQEGASVSPDDNGRQGDITPLDTHRHATIHIHNGTGDMHLGPRNIHGASVSESVNTHLHDEATHEARHHVAAHLSVDVPHLRQTINYEPFDRCEEVDTDSTVTDDTDVENISEEDPYVDVVVLNM
ncbi:uncharacterized protein [Haliotis cracherodii]|uniref:uncharacterized protein n=1 Tax=Haliotis cracherodii TaxID=6455 RepID=UPI0039EBFDF7